MKNLRIAIFIILLIIPAYSMCAHSTTTIRVIEINNHILAFYDGRDPTGKRVFGTDWNWEDDAAMKLGVATYAIYSDNKAIIYDTFPSIEQARWVRNYLERKGINQFTVVLSHWHPDHIAGNTVYQGSNIIATKQDREILVKKKEAIETGEAFGPPAIKPLILPNIDYYDKLDLYINDLKLELYHVNIHSVDGSVIYLPDEKILLAGDTLEDPITYITEVDKLIEHISNLKKLKNMDLEKIYPNHGDPGTIANGGYRKTLIDAMIGYLSKIIMRSHEQDYLKGTLEEYIGDSVSNGWVHFYEPYRSIHQENLVSVHAYYQNKSLPDLKGE